MRLASATLFGRRRAALILMLAVLRERRRDAGHQADKRGRDKKFPHRICPPIAYA
jgi:hypothetical protein